MLTERSRITVGPPRYSLPQCPMLKQRYCTWLSNRCGKLVHATGPICELRCKAHGPYCGREVSAESAAKFTLDILSTHYDEQFLARVAERYNRPITVAVPPVWPTIRNALTSLVSKPYLDAVLLTGSLLVAGKIDHKDYDVALLVNDLDAFLADNGGLHYVTLVGANYRATWNENLPNQINGKNVDYFVLTRLHPFFATLDPEQRKLYTSPFFDLQLVGADGIDIVQVDDPLLRAETRRVLSEIAARIKQRAVPSPTTQTESPCREASASPNHRQT